MMMRNLYDVVKVAGLVAVMGLSLPAGAQDRSGSVAEAEEAAARRAEGRQAMMGRPIRLSGIIGEDVQNAAGDDIADVKDLVVDSRSGQIRYVVLQYGGVLGVGDKMFAVPFEAFQIRQEEADEPEDYVITLNVTEQQLEGAAGFDEDRWPDFANATFTTELDQRYNVQRNQRMRNRADGVQPNNGRPGDARENRRRNRDGDAEVEIRGDRGGVQIDLDDE